MHPLPARGHARPHACANARAANFGSWPLGVKQRKMFEIYFSDGPGKKQSSSKPQDLSGYKNSVIASKVWRN
jgi:hypothetical protein